MKKIYRYVLIGPPQKEDKTIKKRPSQRKIKLKKKPRKQSAKQLV